MHDRELERANTENVRAGLVASLASIGWTACSGASTIVLGLLAGSVVLVAFGGIGAFDAAGSAALVLHFRHALHHQTISAKRDRFAQRVVTAGLAIVGAATTIASALRLISRAHAHEPVAGIVISAVSIVVLGVLTDRKRHIAGRIPSNALLADSWLSLIGCLTAVCAVAGTVLEAEFGWWWADPSAALCIASAAISIAVLNIRQLRSATRAR